MDELSDLIFLHIFQPGSYEWNNSHRGTGRKIRLSTDPAESGVHNKDHLNTSQTDFFGTHASPNNKQLTFAGDYAGEGNLLADNTVGYSDGFGANYNDRKPYIMSSGGKYLCPYCDRTFAASNNLRGHLVTHTGVREFCCTLCGQQFGYKHHLKKHAEKCYPCPS